MEKLENICDLLTLYPNYQLLYILGVQDMTDKNNCCREFIQYQLPSFPDVYC